jgi:hypothetical protein
MLGLERGSAETRSAARERRPWPWHRARSEPSSRRIPRDANAGVGVPIGRCPQPGAEIALHLGRRGDEVAGEGLRSVISAASSGVTMKRK